MRAEGAKEVQKALKKWFDWIEEAALTRGCRVGDRDLPRHARRGRKRGAKGAQKMVRLD